MVIVASVVGGLIICGAIFVLICYLGAGRSPAAHGGDQLSSLDQMDGRGRPKSQAAHSRRAA